MEKNIENDLATASASGLFALDLAYEKALKEEDIMRELKEGE